MSGLPPLNALRVFEAAARHLSFAKAAAELNVTPAAVSHQIKTLEAYLGVQLFRRMTRAVLLTDAAQAALPPLRQAFEKLDEAVALLELREANRPLMVSVAHSFAAKWLVPRLDHFREAHPDIDVLIDPSMDMTDFSRSNVDVAIRYGLGRYPGLRVDRLFTEEVFPVCSPRLLAGERPLKEPADLRHQTLLHVDWTSYDEPWPDWAMWLRAAGVDDVDPRRGPRFTVSSLALQAAVDGHGVVLGSSVLVADDLAARRLMRPFAFGLPINFAYWLVCPEATADGPRIAAFRDWLFSEIEPSVTN